MRQRRFFAGSRAGGEDVAGRRRETPSAGNRETPPRRRNGPAAGSPDSVCPSADAGELFPGPRSACRSRSWSASYRPRSRLSLQAGIALPAEGPARFKVSWAGNAPRPGSRRSRRVGKSAEVDGWPPPAVGDRLSAMLSAGRICRHHAGRKRSAPVPALAAAGRRGGFAPALFRISGASPVPTDVSCSGPGRRDGQPLPALSVIPSSRHRARRCRPSPAEIFIHTIGRGGPASRVPHTPAAPPMPDPGRWVRQPPAALSVLPLRRQRAACSLAAPAGRLDNSYPLSQNGRLHLERLAPAVTLAEPPEHAHGHREPQAFVFRDPAFVGQVQVRQGHGVNRDTA